MGTGPLQHGAHPTIAEEDAKRPNRERECLVGERTRVVNRMKATLARLGIRNFKPTLRKAAERLATLHTPEGSALPPNVSAELQRNMARLGFVVSQIKGDDDCSYFVEGREYFLKCEYVRSARDGFFSTTDNPCPNLKNLIALGWRR